MARAATSQQRLHIEMADVTVDDLPDATGEFAAAPRLPRPDLARDPEHRVHKAALASALFDQPAQIVSFGPYRVVRQLGHGSMGTVYLAEAPRLGRQIALKLLHDEQQLPRLQREAVALAKLSHPNVIQVFDAGSIDGRGFVAMEYVPGQTLHAWLRQHEGPRPWREVLPVFIAAGHGLAAVHAAGIVHRDFKPSNVLLGADGRVRVFDFGLARAHADEADLPLAADDDLADAPLSHALTRTGLVIGTPAYMALEQFRDHVHDARGDQFSFCVTFYEALYGARPFTGESIRDLHAALERGQPADPPADTKVPAWLHAVVVRGLARDPAARWPSMSALLTELARDRYGTRRKRWLVGVIAGLGALACGLATPYALQYRHDAACVAAADAELAEVWGPEARTRLMRAHDITAARPFAGDGERVVESFDTDAQHWRDKRIEGCVRPSPRIAETPWLQANMQRCFDEVRDDIETNLAVLGAAAPANIKLSPVYWTRPDVCLDPSHLVAGVEYPEDLDARRHWQATRALLLRGELAASAGDFAGAEQHLSQAIEASTPAEVQLGLAAREALARTRFAAGRQRAAWAALDDAFTAAATAEAKLPFHVFDALDLHILLGAATGTPRQPHLARLEEHEQSPTHNLAEAVQAAVAPNSGVPLWRTELGGPTSEIASRMLPRVAAVADAWIGLGDFAAAEDAARHGLGYLAAHPQRSALAVDLMLALARAHVGQGLFARGEEALVHARAAIDRAADPATRARRGRLQLALVELRLARGDLAGAARELAVAEDMLQETDTLDDRHAPALALARGRLLARQGDLAGAAVHLARARDGLVASHGVARMASIDATIELARLALAAGRPADAETELREALRDSEALVGPGHPSQLPLVALLGQARHALGDLAGARDSLARARDLLDARVAREKARAALPDPLPRALASLPRSPDHAWAFSSVIHTSDARDPELRELMALLGERPATR